MAPRLGLLGERDSPICTHQCSEGTLHTTYSNLSKKPYLKSPEQPARTILGMDDTFWRDDVVEFSCC